MFLSSLSYWSPPFFKLMLFLSSFWTVGPLYFLSWCYFFPLFELLVLSSFWVVGLFFFLSWCYSSLLYWCSLLFELVLLLSFLWTIVAPLLSLSYYCSSPLSELVVLLSFLWGVDVLSLFLRCSFLQVWCLFFP